MTARPLVALLPRGEAIRNFVYSGALEAVARTRPVDVASVIPNDAIGAMLRAKFGEIAPLVTVPARLPVRLQRELLDTAHLRYVWSEATQTHLERRDHAASRSLGKRVRQLARRAAAMPFANQVGLGLLSSVQRALGQRFVADDHWLDYMREHAPALVFDGSHVHNAVSLPALHAAQRLGIASATFLFSWDNLTSQGRMMPAYDHYLVWNEAIKADLLRIYPRTAPERVTVTGTPQFDFHFRPELVLSREELCARIGADPARPIVLYSTSMDYHTPGEPRIVEAVAQALGQVRGVPRPQLLVRVYPKDRTGRFDSLARKGLRDVLVPAIPWEPNWLTPTYEDCVLLTNTLRHAALGINVASTISLELCMFDKPVLNIGFDPPGVDIRPVRYARYYEFDHYKPVVASGAVEVVWSADALLPAIQAAFDRPGERAGQRRALLERFFGDTLDGASAQRVAAALERIAA